ncbi:uncharacterized protein LOC121373482 [Gigantopelta aegis]|uniref:uncharacterized protein LOC121373482 n=1 Tax=Gigantopelta aegis TaxID=1735272 RepID=UPI001B88A161|nr:uncharacterized protein LOC121373482 [Gigantopelta aegis]
MMDARTETKPPPLKDVRSGRFTAKDKLYNDVCVELKRSGAEFPKSLLPDEVMKQVGAIVDLLWYIDGNVSTIQERSTHVPTEITPVPNRFLKFEGYNDWRKKKSKKPQLHAKDLDIHTQIVFRLTSKPYVHVWNNELKNDLNSLAASLSSYASYLKSSNIKQQTRQQQLYPVRQLQASHQDDHYCAAQFKYMREFAVKHRDRVTFVCLDDKSKLDFGEPGAALSSGVRGGKEICCSYYINSFMFGS